MNSLENLATVIRRYPQFSTCFEQACHHTHTHRDRCSGRRFRFPFFSTYIHTLYRGFIVARTATHAHNKHVAAACAYVHQYCFVIYDAVQSIVNRASQSQWTAVFSVGSYWTHRCWLSFNYSDSDRIKNRGSCITFRITHECNVALSIMSHLIMTRTVKFILIMVIVVAIVSSKSMKIRSNVQPKAQFLCFLLLFCLQSGNWQVTTHNSQLIEYTISVYLMVCCW